MKGVIVVMVLLLAALIVAVALKGNGLLEQAFKTSATSFIKLVPILMVVFLLMGLIEVLLPGDLVRSWLSDAAGFRGMGLAWLAGALTPGGSIISMPIVAGLAKAGVGPGVLVTYLVAVATLSILRAPMEVGFYGWRLMVVRLVACLILPFVAGSIARLVGPWILKAGTSS